MILGLETVASRVDWCSARAQSDEHGEQKKELEGLLWRGDLYLAPQIHRQSHSVAMVVRVDAKKREAAKEDVKDQTKDRAQSAERNFEQYEFMQLGRFRSTAKPARYSF